MSCSDIVVNLAQFNEGAYQCNKDSGYTLSVAVVPPTSTQMAKMCASAGCQTLIEAIRSAVTDECSYKAVGSRTPLQLYAQILTPIETTCKSVTTPPPTTPAPTTAAPTTAAPTKTPTPTLADPDDSSSWMDDPLLSSDGSDGASDSATPATLAPTSTPAVSIDSSQSYLDGTAGNEASDGGSGSLTLILVGVGIGAVIVVAIFALVWRRRAAKSEFIDPEFGNVGEGYATNGTYIPKSDSTLATTTRNSTDNSKKSTDPSGLDGGLAGLWSDHAIQNARIPLEEIQLGQVLNSGAFGEVLLASYHGERVAVKRLIASRRKNMAEIEAFLQEAKLMTTLRHQRIVRLIGVAWDSLSDLCVVTEFMDGGDVRALLVDYSSRNVPVGFSSDKIKIAVHVAHALSYLHNLRPSVVHRDLKSKNVLLTDKLDAKLTDFGVSRLRAELTMTAGVGTGLWMAPEIMMGERYDERADMFSFGILLSELDTHQLPYSDAMEPGPHQRQLPEVAILQMVSLGTLQVSFSDRADEEVVSIGRACVSVDPAARPSAGEVLRRLHHVWQSYGGIV